MTPLRKRMLEELQRRNYAQVKLGHHVVFCRQGALPLECGHNQAVRDSAMPAWKNRARPAETAP